MTSLNSAKSDSEVDVFTTVWTASGRDPSVFAELRATRSSIVELRTIFGVLSALDTRAREGLVSVWDVSMGWVLRDVKHRFRIPANHPILVRPSWFCDADCGSLKDWIAPPRLNSAQRGTVEDCDFLHSADVFPVDNVDQLQGSNEVSSDVAEREKDEKISSHGGEQFWEESSNETSGLLDDVVKVDKASGQTGGGGPTRRGIFGEHDVKEEQNNDRPWWMDDFNSLKAAILRYFYNAPKSKSFTEGQVIIDLWEDENVRTATNQRLNIKIFQLFVPGALQTLAKQGYIRRFEHWYLKGQRLCPEGEIAPSQGRKDGGRP